MHIFAYRYVVLEKRYVISLAQLTLKLIFWSHSQTCRENSWPKPQVTFSAISLTLHKHLHFTPSPHPPPFPYTLLVLIFLPHTDLLSFLASGALLPLCFCPLRAAILTFKVLGQCSHSCNIFISPYYKYVFPSNYVPVQYTSCKVANRQKNELMNEWMADCWCKLT